MQSVRFKIAVAISLAAVSATDIASDWPQFRGPHRDGTWDETGVLEKFPAEGIKIEWKHPAGGGWSSPVVADGKVFVFDAEMIKPKSRERLHCFDEKTGEVLWQFIYEEPYGDWAYVPERGAGPTATPIIDSLLSEKKAREMIIVMPFGHAVEFGGPEQSQNNEKMENYVLKDLAPLIEKNYRVAKGRENRAIVGLSMGGGQALQIGLTHLDKFSVVGAFSSAIPRDFETRISGLLKNPSDTNKKLKLLWIGCGVQDPAIRGSRNLSEVVKKNQINHTFREMEGRHTYTVWRQCFFEIAPQLFK